MTTDGVSYEYIIFDNDIWSYSDNFLPTMFSWILELETDWKYFLSAFCIIRIINHYNRFVWTGHGQVSEYCANHITFRLIFSDI